MARGVLTVIAAKIKKAMRFLFHYTLFIYWEKNKKTTGKTKKVTKSKLKKNSYFKSTTME